MKLQDKNKFEEETERRFFLIFLNIQFWSGTKRKRAVEIELNDYFYFSSEEPDETKKDGKFIRSVDGLQVEKMASTLTVMVTKQIKQGKQIFIIRWEGGVSELEMISRKTESC